MLDDPFKQFSLWFDEAKEVCDEPEAMALATTTPSGVPSCRMVLLKGFDSNGFLFFTNSESRKGKELKQNPLAAVSFYWRELERQVTASGVVTQMSSLESDRYFATRPRLSQLGAWASHQDEEIPSREILLEKLEFFTKKFEGQSVPRPPYWNGYRIMPNRVEFWQGREGRLHDRFQYQEEDKWVIKRLSP